MSTWLEYTELAYADRRPVARTIDSALPRERVVITGVIHSSQITEDRGGPSYECLIDDGTGRLGLLFLGRRHVAGLNIGTHCTVEGIAGIDRRRLVVWNPIYRIEPPSRGLDEPGRSNRGERVDQHTFLSRHRRRCKHRGGD